MALQHDALFSVASAYMPSDGEKTPKEISKLIDLALNYLDDDEQPEAGIFASHKSFHGDSGFLWITNKRLLFAGEKIGWTRQPISLDHSYNTISSVEIDAPDAATKIVKINSGGNRTNYAIWWFNRFDDFVALLRNKVTTATTPQVAQQSSDLMTQLEHLSQLKKQGMITEEEYKAAKVKLLGM